MTLLDLTTVFFADELVAACAQLGLRRPLGLVEPLADDQICEPNRSAGPLASLPVSDTNATALAALSSPEAIAVVDRRAGVTTRRTYIAVRGPVAAVHHIEGHRHTLEVVDAEDAATKLLDAAGLGDVEGNAVDAVVDVTRGGFDRMTELLAAGDVKRATAALVADGADETGARAIVEATRTNAAHVLGLRSVGLRYEGCELSWVGNDPARWLVPLPARSSDTGFVISHLGPPRHLRVQIQPVTSEFLATELSLLFG